MTAPDVRPGLFRDFQTVEAELVEAGALWLRSPRVGHLPIRSAWPDIVRETMLGDYDASGGDQQTPEPTPLPLTRDEVAYRDTVSSWIAFVPDAADRRLVSLVTMHRARGTPKFWHKVLRQMGMKRGLGGLQQRYRKAITAICNGVNG